MILIVESVIYTEEEASILSLRRREASLINARAIVNSHGCFLQFTHVALQQTLFALLCVCHLYSKTLEVLAFHKIFLIFLSLAS